MSFQVLLVDDESIFLEFMRHIIDWSSYDCTICGISKSGEDALEKIEQLKPDIVFLDISMSCMNGLEVCEQVKQRETFPKIIIMTAHNDFTFAQQAIKLNVFDYLLKPFDKYELTATLCQCITKIEQEQNLQRYQQESKLLQAIRAKENLPNDAGIDFKNNACFVVVILRLQDPQKLPENILRKLLANYCCDSSNYIIGREGRKILLLHVFSERDDVLSDLKNTYEEMLNDTNACFIKMVAIGSVHTTQDKLSNSYEHAMITYENSLKLPDCVVAFHDVACFQQQMVQYGIQDINLLIRYFESRDYEKVDSIIEKIFGLSQNQLFSFQYVISVYHSLAVSVYTRLHQEDDKGVLDYLATQASIVQDLNDCLTLEQTFAVIKNYVYELFSDFVTIQEGDKKELLVHKIEQYLQQNYKNSELSVDELAKQLFFENSYLRRIYKSKTGNTIVQKLEEIRMQHAKVLLMEEKYRHNEIAKKCGFSDPYYFSKRFKLVCGVTPSEYQMLKQ